MSRPNADAVRTLTITLRRIAATLSEYFSGTNDMTKIKFPINGEEKSVTAPPIKRLLDVLREDLHLTGTKEGCGEGECGSCSVLLNGELVNSCLIPVLQAQGAVITT